LTKVDQNEWIIIIFLYVQLKVDQNEWFFFYCILINGGRPP
jgi:hypothetical protein